MYEKRRKRIWVQHVAVGAESLQTRLDVAGARGLTPEQEAVSRQVAQLVEHARDAALRKDPIPGRWWNWWRGTLVEASYRNLHAARAEIVDLYDEADLQAEARTAIARAQATMRPDDPRNVSSVEIEALPVPARRATLRQLVQHGYDAIDQEHAQLRSFRNVVLMAAVSITVLTGATIWFVAHHPSFMPLCFPYTATDVSAPSPGRLVCPTKAITRAPSHDDVLMVGLLGLLGGSLSAAVSIRNLRGTATSYDVPVALAMLKVPLGAFTAIVGLVAIRGEFVPGLSSLDSQSQILAYALILGFAQQVFTRLLDNRAQDLLSGIPGHPTPASKTPAGPATVTPQLPAPRPPADAGAAPAEQPVLVPVGAPEIEAEEGAAVAPAPEPEPAYLPNPEGDDDEQVQDADDEAVLPDPPEQDHR